MELDLQIKNPSRYPVDRERLFGVMEKTLRQEDRKIGRYVVSVLIADKEEMAKFNVQYHQTEGPTDVLSFPYTDPQSQVSNEVFVTPPEEGIILGDLIVCYPVAVEVAEKEGKTPQDLVDFYVDHGLHHLLGHHHE